MEVCKNIFFFFSRILLSSEFTIKKKKKKGERNRVMEIGEYFLRRWTCQVIVSESEFKPERTCGVKPTVFRYRRFLARFDSVFGVVSNSDVAIYVHRFNAASRMKTNIKLNIKLLYGYKNINDIRRSNRVRNENNNIFLYV